MIPDTIERLSRDTRPLPARRNAAPSKAARPARGEEESD
jgi:hypothetical protein